MTRAQLALLIVAILAVLAVAVAVAMVVVSRRRAAERARRARDLPRWPIVLVHGLCGFDALVLGGGGRRYFRGVVTHLESRGLRVYRPRLPGVGSVPERAEKLADYIRSLPDDKVNVIAHSMAGLDARYAIARLGLGDRVASLVTIGTPHRGSPVADLVVSGPARLVRAVFQRVGGKTHALEWLTTRSAGRFNDEIVDDLRVKYYSVVTRARPARSLNPILFAPHYYLRRRAGSNDGLVPASSQRWGEILVECDADHWGQIGWSIGNDPADIYDRILVGLAARGV
jgi:triacylglycerol lipase